MDATTAAGGRGASGPAMVSNTSVCRVISKAVAAGVARVGCGATILPSAMATNNAPRGMAEERLFSIMYPDSPLFLSICFLILISPEAQQATAKSRAGMRSGGHAVFVAVGDASLVTKILLDNKAQAYPAEFRG